MGPGELYLVPTRHKRNLRHFRPSKFKTVNNYGGCSFLRLCADDSPWERKTKRKAINFLFQANSSAHQFPLSVPDPSWIIVRAG